MRVLQSLSAWTYDGDVEEKEEQPRSKQPGHQGDYRVLVNQDDVSAGVDPNAVERRFLESAAGDTASGGRCSKVCEALSFFGDVESDKFQLVIGLVIMANAIVIGLETHLGNKLAFLISEHVLQAIFMIEMTLRMRHEGIGYFRLGWNLFDFMLVLVGTLDLWVLPLVSFATGDSHNGSLYHFSAARLLRILRLLRVLRVIRLFRMFNQLYLIMQAFNKAFQIVGLISLLILILDYVCAIVLTQAVGTWAAQAEEDPSLPADRQAKLRVMSAMFGTIPDSMQTLFLVMTLSNWDIVAQAIEEEVNPSARAFVYLALVVYIMITTYTGTSLITGIISDSLVTAQVEYKERAHASFAKRRREVYSELVAFLQEMHEEEMDCFGRVDHEDLKTSMRGDTELLDRLARSGCILDEQGLLALIDNLSRNGKEKVCLSYFADKITNLVGVASASSVADLRNEMMQVHRKLDRLAERQFPNDNVYEAQLPTKELPTVRASCTSGPPKRSSIRQSNREGPRLGKHMKASFCED